MTYYEELGVSPTATPEEIKRAYRQISKLLHPDIQTDDNVRQIAEIQQKRLNAIIATLSNPEERRLYDESLRPPEPMLSQMPMAAHLDAFVPAPPPGAFRSSRRQTYMWLGLFALPLVGSVLFWWNTERNIVGVPVAGSDIAVTSEPSSQEPDKTASSKLPAPSPAAPAAPPVSLDLLPPPAPMLSLGSRKEFPPTAQARASHGNSLAPPASASSAIPSGGAVQAATTLPPPPAITPPAVPSTSLPVMPRLNVPAAPPSDKPASSTPASSQTAAAAASTPAAVSTAAPSGVSGMWIYIPTTNGKSNNRAIYPPDFVELALQETRGHMRGLYRSRYRVADRPVSPDVNFQFQGSEKSPQQYSWKTADGTRGQVRLQQLSATTLQVDWFVTQFGRTPGLASGSAVLTRRP